ncbi:MAG: hypothetical protein U7M05_11485 [Candidatus Igneacidithiobacillus chanchocoensis]
MSEPTQTHYSNARAAWRAAKAREAGDFLETLTPALRADLQALRDAGLTFTINPSTPAPPPRPVRAIRADEVGHLDAADPMRTLYQYQRAYSRLTRPVPTAIINNLRAAYRDHQARQKARQRLRSGQP